MKELTTEEVKQFQCVKDWLAEVGTRRTGSDRTQQTYPRELAKYCNWRPFPTFYG